MNYNNVTNITKNNTSGKPNSPNILYMQLLNNPIIYVENGAIIY